MEPDVGAHYQVQGRRKAKEVHYIDESYLETMPEDRVSLFYSVSDNVTMLITKKHPALIHKMKRNLYDCIIRRQ